VHYLPTVTAGTLLTLAVCTLQSAVGSVEFDWVSLLLSDLGLSEIGFRCLLFNRYDMQDDAELDDTRRKYAGVLRRKFDQNVAGDSAVSVH